VSIFEEIIGEFLVAFIWRKIIGPFFLLSGAAIRLLFNFKKLSRQEILDKDHNKTIGVLFWLIIIIVLVLIFK